MRRRGWAGLGVTVGLAAALTGCAGPTQAEYEAAIAQFRSLPDEAKAYACAEDWYAVRFGVQGFVIVEECSQGAAAPVTRSEPLSSTFEDGEIAYARSYYEANPPTSGLLRRVDEGLLCDQTEEQVRAGIEQWRQQTRFPSWDGVEYVPSVELEATRLEIWREAACPVLQD